MAAGMELEVRSPFDGTFVGAVPLTAVDGVECALATAYRLFRNRGGWLPVPRRIEVLSATAKRMEAIADELALLIAQEGGKPLLDAQVEVSRAIDGVRNCCELLRSDAGRLVRMNVNAASAGRVAFTQAEPIGVVVALSAFNHPLNLIVHQVAPAIAAGCPVIVKPAAATPLSCFRFVALLHEAGLPEGWCQAVALDGNELAGALAADPRVGFLSFIGSARVGWSLRAKLAPGARCALEHGGAAPVIVAADADLDRAATALTKGASITPGRSASQCSASLRTARSWTSWAASWRRGPRRSRSGNPTSAETEVGPLIRPGEVDRVHAWVEEAVAGGGTLLCGGEAISESCYQPTVVLDPPADCRLSREEVFGPVVAVYRFEDFDDACARANDLRWSFQAAVFTRDYETAMRVYRGLDASAVMLNDHTAFRVNWMPFAGLRQSGLGVGGIPYTFREMQVEKMFVGAMP